MRKTFLFPHFTQQFQIPNTLLAEFILKFGKCQLITLAGANALIYKDINPPAFIVQKVLFLSLQKTGNL